MKTANMHKEKSQLTKNSTAAENSVDEFIWREGHPSVNCDLPPLKQQHRNLQPHPDLKVTLAPGYDPAEPLQPDELPDWMK